jgi:hypothetical protein
MLKIFLLLILAFTLVNFLLLGKSYPVKVSLALNSTEVEWNESVNASGYIKFGESPWVGNVSIQLEGKEVCNSTTNSDGFYSCVLFAPREIGEFFVVAYAKNDSTIVGESNKVLLSVIYRYGGIPRKNIATVSFPLLLQDLNGKIHRVVVYLKVWE